MKIARIHGLLGGASLIQLNCIIKERIIPNTRHAVSNGDAGNVGAIIERIRSNTRNTVGNGYAGHGGVPTAEDGGQPFPTLTTEISFTTAGISTAPPAPE